MTIQRKAAVRLSAGSAEVARRIGRAAAGASLGVKLGAGLAAWKGGPVLLAAAHQQPLLPVAATGAWCWAAWALGSPAETAAAVDDEESDEEIEETAEDDVAGAAAEFLAELHRLMPHPGDRLHVAQIAEQLYGSAAEAPRVRELCAAVRVPIKPVRVKGRGSSTGIARDNLPPVVGVVAAGHSSDNNTEGAQVAPAREGFYTAPHPTDPHRTEVRWIAEKVP
ncbi:hypothetical protein [Kitasatospora phosalacinea]|uniref:Uncharacterized protein n=1 Tax=Kitasatospora phosalacinea TaxID=2065 RepID=A0ABW6GRE2_9ACTN